MKFRPVAATLLVSAACLILPFTAQAAVVSGSSSAYGEQVVMTHTNFMNFTTLSISSGPSPKVSGTAPGAYNFTGALASASASSTYSAIVLSTGIMDVNAASNLTGGACSSLCFAGADATVNSLSVLASFLNATSVQSTAKVSGDFGALGAVGKTTIVGLDSQVLSFNAWDGIKTNFDLYKAGGLTITLNEQKRFGDEATNQSIEVNAIHVNFLNFGHNMGVLNGDIFIAQSKAALNATQDVTGQVPEPATLVLVATSLLGLGMFRRRKV